MKKVTKKELIKALNLDFSKYEYYTDIVAFRYNKVNKTTESFDKKSLKWEPTEFDIVKKFNIPFDGDDVDMWNKSQKDRFIDFVFDSVNYENKDQINASRTMLKTSKKNNNLVEQYFACSLRLSDENITKTEENKIYKKMDEIQQKFNEKDWDELIHSVPIFIRPMLSKQKKECLKNKK